jgi:hypothetical protein
MPLPAEGTLLVLSGMGIPLYSARGLSQSLRPIGATAHAERTVNGTLVDLSAAQFRKFASTISCSDQRAPAIDDIWPGMIVTVDCVATLAYPSASSGAGGIRDAVEGSEITEGNFTHYRPRLEMMVMDYAEQVDEWGAVVAWSLELEEV